MTKAQTGSAHSSVDAAPALDEHGHLVDVRDWTPTVADRLAAQDGIELAEDHWWLIEFVRDYHLTYGNPPLMRTVVSALKRSRPEVAGSRFLYRLFPDGPIRLACKYGGLPPPDWCL